MGNINDTDGATSDRKGWRVKYGILEVLYLVRK